MVIKASQDLNAWRSPNDGKDYRHVTLNSGLECMLIHASDQYKAAAALSVGVGSLSDPLNLCQGLAHYCEHMLFMGTQKYPGENELNDFLYARSGSSNAWTDSEHTTYVFDIMLGKNSASPQNDLEKACDIFAQYFVSPLFNDSSSQREVEAVESEFRGTFNSDSSRMSAIFSWLSDGPRLKALLNGDLQFEPAGLSHPHSGFGWGNLESLKVENIREYLLYFHRKHYFAENMRLAIQSHLDLDTMQGILERCFEGVPTMVQQAAHYPENPSFAAEFHEPHFREVPRLRGCPHHSGRIYLDFSHFPAPISELPLVIHMKPNRLSHQLDIQFQLPCIYQYNQTKAPFWVEFCVADEGEGSLLSRLRDLGLATELCATCEEWVAGFGSLFSIHITLTREGFYDWNLVASLCFAYLRCIRKTFEKTHFDHIKKVSEASYTYKEEQDPFDYVSEMAEVMLPIHEYRLEELLKNEYILEFYDRSQLLEILDCCVPSKCVIFVVSSNYELLRRDEGDSGTEDGESDDYEEDEGKDDSYEDDGYEEDGSDSQPSEVDDTPFVFKDHPNHQLDPQKICKEKWFGPKFVVQKLEADYLQQFETHEDTKLSLFPENRFMAENFEIMGHPPGPQVEPRVEDIQRLHPEYPAIPYHRFHDGLSVDPHVILAPDTQYKEPYASLYVEVTMVPELMKEDPLKWGGCRYLWGSLCGHLLGEPLYMAHVARLSCQLSSWLNGVRIEVHGFSDKLCPFLVEVCQTLKAPLNLSQAKFDLIKTDEIRALRNKGWHSRSFVTVLRWWQLIEGVFHWDDLLPVLETLTLADFLRFHQAVFKACFKLSGFGNLNKAQMEALNSELSQLFEGPRYSQVSNFCVLKPGRALLVVQPARDPHDPNCALQLTFLSRVPQVDTRKCRLCQVILEQMISEPFFNELRTIQQLGYHVSSSIHFINPVRVNSLVFTIQSATHTADELLAAILKFVAQTLTQLLETTTEATFSSIVSRQGDSFLEKWQSLSKWCSDRHEIVEAQGFDVRGDSCVRDAEVLSQLTLEDVKEFARNYVLPGGASRTLVVTAALGSGSKSPNVETTRSLLAERLGCPIVYDTRQEAGSLEHLEWVPKVYTDVDLKL